MLEGARAHEADFSGGIFRYSRLAQCDFTGSKLSGADMSVADLRGNFTGADLYGADLRGSKLNNANLTGADLSKAKFDGANLIGANLTNAKISPEQLHNARATGVIGRRTGGGAAPEAGLVAVLGVTCGAAPCLRRPVAAPSPSGRLPGPRRRHQP